MTLTLLRSQRLLRGWIAIAGILLCALGIHLIKAGRNWPLGDWLINYEGGFVRRGLLGEVLLLLAHTVHLDPVALAAALSLACYAVLLAGLWWLLRAPTQPWWVVFALLSPALLTFPLLSTRAGFHKEVLLYAALTMLLVAFREDRHPSRLKLATGLTATCLVLILSHEPVLFYLPYLFVVPLIAMPDWRYTLQSCTIPAVATVAAFAVVLRHIGSPQIVAAICRSVHAGPADPCADPIGFLTMTRAGQLAMVGSNVAEFHYFRHFPLLLGLSSLPLIIGLCHLWQTVELRRTVRLVLFVVACSGAASLVLFRFAPDWGRWIAMHVVCLTLLLLWLANRHASEQPEPVDPPAIRTFQWADVLWSVGLLAYAGCWSMPGFGDTPLHGIIGLLLHRP